MPVTQNRHRGPRLQAQNEIIISIQLACLQLDWDKKIGSKLNLLV